MMVFLILLVVIILIGGKAGVEAVKGLLMLAFGALLLMVGCGIG